MDPLSLLGRAVAVFLLLGITLWLLRRTDGLKKLRRSETPLEVLGSARLGKGASVALVRIGDNDYALGVTDQAVSLLTEAELADEPEPVEAGEPKPVRPGFPAALQSQLGLLTRRGHGSRLDSAAATEPAAAPPAEPVGAGSPHAPAPAPADPAGFDDGDFALLLAAATVPVERDVEQDAERAAAPVPASAPGPPDGPCRRSSSRSSRLPRLRSMTSPPAPLPAPDPPVPPAPAAPAAPGPARLPGMPPPRRPAPPARGGGGRPAPPATARTARRPPEPRPHATPPGRAPRPRPGDTMPALTALPTRTVRQQGIARRVLAGGLTALALVVGVPTATPASAAPALAVAAPAGPAAPAPVTPVGPEGEAAATGPAAGAPAAPAPPQPGTPPSPADPSLRVDLGGSGDSPMNSPLTLVLLLGAMSFIPAALVMMTAFTRIVIVLGFVRTGLGTMGIPPNQVVIGLALFLSLFVMAPTLKEANEEAVKPFMAGEITQQVAFERGLEPFRDFMLTQVRDEDLSLFVKLSGDERPANASEVATTTLIPAFVVSELRTAFLIGFVIFIPFIVIDLIVSAALSATGMMMLPPALLSLPFKVLLFVVADGWSLVIESLVKSFNA